MSSTQKWRHIFIDRLTVGRAVEDFQRLDQFLIRQQWNVAAEKDGHVLPLSRVLQQCCKMPFSHSSPTFITRNMRIQLTVMPPVHLRSFKWHEKIRIAFRQSLNEILNVFVRLGVHGDAVQIPWDKHGLECPQNLLQSIVH